MNTSIIKKETLKNFLVNSGYIPACGFLMSMEMAERKLRYASNPYYWKCGEERMTLEEDLKKFAKHILWIASDWRHKGNESFINGFVDVKNASECLSLIESLITLLPDVLLDIEHDKYISCIAA